MNAKEKRCFMEESELDDVADLLIHQSWKEYPKLFLELNLSKNKGLTFRGKPVKALELACGTNKRLDWKCSDCEHEWKSAGSHRVNGKGCPFCSGNVIHIDGRNSMAKTHPKLAKEYQGDATKIMAGTHKKLDWKCSVCDNEWSAQGGSRTRQGTGCPYCGGTNNSLHSDRRNSMKNTHPLLAEEFHPKKNGKLSPENLVAGTEEKIWWICKTCEHEWKNSGKHRSIRGQGCNACAGKVVHIDGRNSMRNANPDLASDFHPTKNGDLTTDNVLSGSHKKYWWLCSTCSHEWNADRHTGNQCPACSRQAVHSDGRNSMRSTHPGLAEEFHPTKNGDLTPDNLLAGTNIKIWWICSECSYVWDTVGNNRIDRTNQKGSNCPSCAVSGFDGSKPAFLYALHYRTTIDEWYKVGITNNEVHYRVNQLLLSVKKTKMYYDAEITILEKMNFELGRDAEQLERIIKKAMENDGLKFFPSESFSGIYEFVIRHPFEYAREKGFI